MKRHSTWQWGHPDDWSDEEWADYESEPRRARLRNMLVTAALLMLLALGGYWLGVGF